MEKNRKFRYMTVMARMGSAAVFTFMSLIALASKENNPLYTSGKIYVVVAVLLILFIGLLIYLFKLDRKVKNLEDK